MRRQGWNLKRDAARKPQERRSKYGAVKTTVDGIVFHSAKEARRYGELKLLVKAGEIHDLRCQHVLELAVPIGGYVAHKVVGKYLADFVYCACRRVPCVRSHLVYEDVKGFKTPLYRWKKRHVEAQFGIQIVEI